MNFYSFIMVLTLMNEFDHSILAPLKQQRERPEFGGGGSNPDLCHASAVLYYLSYQAADWEQVIMWVHYNLSP